MRVRSSCRYLRRALERGERRDGLTKKCHVAAGCQAGRVRYIWPHQQNVLSHEDTSISSKTTFPVRCRSGPKANQSYQSLRRTGSFFLRSKTLDRPVIFELVAIAQKLSVMVARVLVESPKTLQPFIRSKEDLP